RLRATSTPINEIAIEHSDEAVLLGDNLLVIKCGMTSTDRLDLVSQGRLRRRRWRCRRLVMEIEEVIIDLVRSLPIRLTQTPTRASISSRARPVRLSEGTLRE